MLLTKLKNIKIFNSSASLSATHNKACKNCILFSVPRYLLNLFVEKKKIKIEKKY